MNRPLGLAGNPSLKTLDQWIAEGRLPRGWIDGLILSNDTTDATNDIAIAAGVARSTVNIRHSEPSTLSRDQVDLELPVGIIKQLDVAWAPENYDPDGVSGGGRSGGRSGSSISNTTWHVFLIGGAGLPTDVMFHDSATQSSVVAQLPTGYTAFRNIGAVIRSGGSILAFSQFNDEYLLSTKATDFNGLPASTNAILRTLTVPIGVAVTALIIGSYRPASSTSGYCYLSSPDEADQAASAAVHTVKAELTSEGGSFQTSIRTNTSGQIRTRVSAAASSDNLTVTTRGWLHPRGRNL